MELIELLKLEASIGELILRSTILYLGILLLMRILPRRTGGELAMMDLIFVLLIAQAAANSFGHYTSIAEGFIVIATLMFWNYMVNVLSFYLPFVEKLVSASPIQIIKDGKLLRRNMRKEYLTEEELMDFIRKQGIEDIGEIKSGRIEADGEISIIKKQR